ncbi:Fructosamine/Ketosamine-3-kinase [Bisporella sp. PMI_857]|nr:Fructosamine/Ketosamine-3-kinase [Bisporella sp. PMI_857]
MAPKLDPSIVKALSLDLSKTTISSHGSSGFASTFKITTAVNEQEKLFFIKTGTGKGGEIMFTGEHSSLNAIHSTVPSFCPKSYAHGTLSSGGYFLATDFLNLSATSPKGTGDSLAQKLVKLHSKPAPAPEGQSTLTFGFPVTTCCGDTEQDNTYKSSWAEFYADNRLRHILKKAEKNNGADQKLASLVEKTATKVVPRLLADGHLRSSDGGNVVPVVVHGDLWSGNHGRGSIGTGGVEEVVFDPSASWSHSEFEFGIMRMFGGFGAGFEKEYHDIKPKDEPVEEYEDRVRLYELYHHLNHYSIFGGGYKGGAVRIMEELIRKYGD